jgi:predicted DNA binding protein
MSVIAEFTIEAAEFVLGKVLARSPDTHVGMERIVPATGRVMPYVRVHGPDFEAFERAVRESRHVRSLTALDVVGGSALYRVEWDENVESLLHGMAETDATILEARGNDRWFLRVRFDDHAGLTAFHSFCTENAISFRLDRVYTLANDHRGGYALDLTDAQRRALVAAVEGGYFEVPRGTTLTEVGEQPGVTEQSAGSVRRGANAVLRKVLLSNSADDLRR